MNAPDINILNSEIEQVIIDIKNIEHKISEKKLKYYRLKDILYNETTGKDHLNLEV